MPAQVDRANGGPISSELRLDPITFEVLRHRFVSLVDEMGVRLYRAAFSPPINQGRDYSIALLDPEGQLVTAGQFDMPFHYGTFQFTVEAILKEFGPNDINPGDVYLMNDPHMAGTHQPDVRTARPVFFDGSLRAWLITMGHWTDVGGPVPGSFNIGATDCWSEGLRITPIRIYQEDQRVESVIRFVLANLRVPEFTMGDLFAQVHALYRGEEQFIELLERYGPETIDDSFADLWDYAERILRQQTRELPDGTYNWTDTIDCDPAVEGSGPISIRLALTVDDGKLKFDLTKSDDGPKGPVGSGLPATWSAIYVSVLSLFPGVPLNHGVRRVLEVETVPRSVVHVLPPRPCNGCASGAVEKVIGCSIGALGLAAPDRKAACMYNLLNVFFGGHDARVDRDFVMYIWELGGFGATARGDMTLPMSQMYGPGVRTQPAEVVERFWPLIVAKRGLREGSAGAGKFRGGWGTDTRFHLSKGSTATVSLMGDRKTTPIWGVEGGGPGAHQDVLLHEPGQKEATELGMFVRGIPVGDREEFVMLLGGGGGYGDPLDRDPEAVLEDVIDELLTTEQARKEYGVIVDAIDPDLNKYAVDAQGTQKERHDVRKGAVEEEAE